MRYQSEQPERQIQSSDAAPEMTMDERSRAIREFIDSGQVRHITTADVIAYHDEINKLIA